MQDCILIVDDDMAAVDALVRFMSENGFRALVASSASQCVELLRHTSITAVVADVASSAAGGLGFVRDARRASAAPIIVCSQHGDAVDRIECLEAGADAFVPKPADPLEVLACLRAALRRDRLASASALPAEQQSGEGVIAVNDYTLDLNELVLHKGTQAIPLTASEMKIVAKLMSAPGCVFTKEQLHEALTGRANGGSSGTVMVHMSNIRNKVEDNPAHPTAFVTARGLGYRFDG